MSDFKVMDIALKDQASTKSALESFELLINNFPNSRYKQPAVEKRDICLNSLARNIMEIGRYYFRTGSYQSAIVRLQSLTEKYPNHANKDEALFLMAESYFNSQNFSKARRKYHKLLKEHPQSLYAKEARSRLRKMR